MSAINIKSTMPERILRNISLFMLASNSECGFFPKAYFQIVGVLVGCLLVAQQIIDGDQPVGSFVSFSTYCMNLLFTGKPLCYWAALLLKALS